MIKKVSKTFKIVLVVVFLILIFVTFVYGEDKIGQGDVIDLTNSKPKEGVVLQSVSLLWVKMEPSI